MSFEREVRPLQHADHVGSLAYITLGIAVILMLLPVAMVLIAPLLEAGK